MIRDERALTDRGEVAAPADLRSGNTLGGIVLTDGGAALGTLEDVILEIEASAVVVGYQVRTSEALPPPPGGTVFLRLPMTRSPRGRAWWSRQPWPISPSMT